MLNSAATIFTIDVYQRRLRPDASQSNLIATGRLSTVFFLILAASWSPFLLRFERVFSYIQEFWGLITPGVAVVFLAGLFWHRATAQAAAVAMATTLPVTIGIKLIVPDMAFPNQMWVAALILAAVAVAVSQGSKQPAPEAARAHETVQTSVTPGRDRLFDLLCLGVVVITGLLCWVFF